MSKETKIITHFHKKKDNKKYLIYRFSTAQLLTVLSMNKYKHLYTPEQIYVYVSINRPDLCTYGRWTTVP